MTPFQKALVRGLTEEQRDAVTAPLGENILVRAGAGTGKTRVLTHRIAWCISEGIHPGRIMAVTFTRKAAREMDTRLWELFGLDKADDATVARAQSRGWPMVGTYHGTAARLLRKHADRIEEITGRKVDRAFTIIDEGEVLSALKRVARTLVEDLEAAEEQQWAQDLAQVKEAKRQGATLEKADKAIRVQGSNGPWIPEKPPKPRRLEAASAGNLQDCLDWEAREAVSMDALIEEMRREEATVSLSRPQGTDRMERLSADVVEAYVRWKDEQGVLDYGDLVQLAVQLVEGDPTCAPEVEIVLCDEYQDTDPLQERWLEAVSQAREAIRFAVGDGNQLIYAWRGARIEHIVEAGKREGWKAKNLTVNFRSGPPVLRVANRALEENKVKAGSGYLRCIPAREHEGGLVRMHVFPDELSEALWIVRTIWDRWEAGVKPGRNAVLARVKRVWHTLDTKLGQTRIPYQVVAGKRFAQEAEIVDVGAWLRLALNPADDLALERVLMKEKRFGARSVQTVLEWAAEVKEPASLCLDEVACSGRLTTEAQGVVQRVAGKLQEIGAALDAREDVEAFLERLVRLSGIRERIGERCEDADPKEAQKGEAQRERLEDLKSIARGCAGLLDLHEHLSVNDLPPDAAPDAAVTIGSVHIAKGGEWPNVVLMAFEDDVLPVAGSDQEEEGAESDDGGLEEERRILHVAATRAMHTLDITCAMERNRTETQVSRFAGELGDTVLVQEHGVQDWDERWSRRQGVAAHVE